MKSIHQANPEDGSLVYQANYERQNKMESLTRVNVVD